MVSVCTLDNGGGRLAQRNEETDQPDDWFRGDDDDWSRDKDREFWSRDKDREFDNLIIGSLTIGLGGPTTGGTGIVGGAGNTAGGTTAGIGGITAGGTTVGGFGNTGNNGGTTVNALAAADDAAALDASKGPSTCDPAAIAAGSTSLTAPDPVAGTNPATGTTWTAKPTSTAPASSDYERGWRDGWAARGRQDSAAVSSVGVGSSVIGSPAAGGTTGTDGDSAAVL